MSFEQLKEVETLIAHNRDQADFAGPKAEELISRAERTLSLAFPPTYRTFVSRYGCGNLASAEFYGLMDDDFVNSSVPDAVWLTLNERRESELPEALLLIGSSGDGGYYAIDTSQTNADRENPVVICGPDGASSTKVAEDFGEFALQTIRQALTY